MRSFVVPLLAIMLGALPARGQSATPPTNAELDARLKVVEGILGVKPPVPPTTLPAGEEPTDVNELPGAEVSAVTGRAFHMDVADTLKDGQLPPLVEWRLFNGRTLISKRGGFNTAVYFTSAGRYRLEAAISPVDAKTYSRAWNITVTDPGGKTVIVSDEASLVATMKTAGDADTTIVKGNIVLNNVLKVRGRLAGDPKDGVDTIRYRGPQYAVNDKTGKPAYTLCAIEIQIGGSVRDMVYVNEGRPNPLPSRDYCAHAFSISQNGSILNLKMSGWRSVTINYSNDILVQGCEHDDTLLDYFCWNNSRRICVFDNKAYDSKNEHISRGGAYELLAQCNNDFQNMDRRPAEPNNTGKGTLVFQWGKGAYSYHNTIRGPFGFGPLGGGDGGGWNGTSDLNNRLVFAVSQGDQLISQDNVAAFCEVLHGLNYFRIVDLKGDAKSHFGSKQDGFGGPNDAKYPPERLKIGPGLVENCGVRIESRVLWDRVTVK